jgi:hypothetical protein
MGDIGVKSNRVAMEAMLRWYPAAWRQRYGEELVVLMEDSERPLTLKVKLSLVRAGLREHLHETGLAGGQHPATERARAGSLLVLCAWTAFVLAGASFSKASEHFAQALPVSSGAVPGGAFDIVAVVGSIGATLVALGAIAALPSFVQFLRAGGWASIRRHVIRANVLTTVTVGAVFSLSSWAHHLNEFQRNGGDGLYSGAIAVWALLVAGTLAQWTVVGVVVARKLDLTRRVLRTEAILGVAVAGAMVIITAATALWWGAMAKDAPWFLQGTAIGTHPSPFTFQLIMTMALMFVAVLVATYGVVRIARSWTALTLV